MGSSIILKKGKEQSLLRFHPWVFSGAIARMEGNPTEGDVVDVISADGTLIGAGHYQVGSITVRMLTFEPEKYTANYWNQRVTEAYLVRKSLG